MKKFSSKALAMLLAVLMIVGTMPAFVISIGAEGGAALPLVETDPTLTDADQTNGVFVASTGSDSNDGTLAAPVATLDKAYDLVADGGIIYVMDDITVAATFVTDEEKSITLTSCNADGKVGGENNTIWRAEGVTSIQMKKGGLTITNLTFDYAGTSATAGRYLIVSGTWSWDNKTLNSKCTTTIGTGVVMQNNKTTDNGGAIAPGGGDDKGNKHTFNIDGAKFLNNYSSAKGGAVTLGQKVGFNVNNAIFENNKADGAGGAIYKEEEWGNDKNATSVIKNTKFINNRASDGGAIYAKNNSDYHQALPITLETSLFQGNAATGQGGAIAFYQLRGRNNTKITMKNAIFTGNSAAEGGAIYATADITFNGGIYAYNNTATTAYAGFALFRNADQVYPINGGAYYIYNNTVNGAQSNLAHARVGGVRIQGVVTGLIGIDDSKFNASTASGVKFMNKSGTVGGFACFRSDVDPSLMGADNNGGVWTAADATRVVLFTVEKGTVLGTVSFTIGDTSVTEPAIPTREGWIGRFDEYTLGNTSIVVNAEYVPADVTVNYRDENGNLITSIKYDYDNPDHSNDPLPPAKPGYSAVWETYGFDKLEVDIKPIYTIIEYTATFVADGAIVSEQTFTVKNMKVDVPALPDKAGYLGFWPAFKLELEDIEIVANYYTEEEAAQTYRTATFFADGVEVGSVDFCILDTELQAIPVPDRAGFPVGAYEGVWETYMLGDANLSINAVYTPVTYVATFVADDATVKEVSFTIESLLDTSLVEIPAKRGYSAEWEAFAYTTEDITISAIYTPIDYTVTYIIEGETVAVVPYNAENMDIEEPRIPRKKGYSFAWEGYDLYDFEDITVNAIYTPLEVVYDVGITASALKLEGEIAMMFAVAPKQFKVIHDDYSFFVEVEYKGEFYELRDYELGDGYYIFTFPGINAKEMTEPINATLVVESAGASFCGDTVEYTVAKYATKVLETSKDDYLKTMLVSMLEYGAAAQQYFGYNLDKLANADVAGYTSEHFESAKFTASYLTKQSAAKLFDGVDDAIKGIMYGVNVDFESAMTMNFIINPEKLEGSEKFGVLVWGDKPASYTYEDAYANGMIINDYEISDGKLVYSIDNLCANQINDTMYICTYMVDEDGTYSYSQVLRYSVNDYCVGMAENAETADFASAITLYGLASEYYFAVKK